MTSWALAAVVVALTHQAVPLTVPTIGEPDVVARLNDTDIAVIKERARESCSPLWLVQAFRGELADSQFVAAYCAAAPLRHGDVYLRRGSYVNVTIRPASPWAVSGTGQYAQVTDTAAPDQVPGVRDIRRPFRVRGAFTDAELISLVAFLRSSTRDERVEGGWPLSGVWKNGDGSVDVALARDDLAAQRVTLRHVDQRWDVVRVVFVIA